MSSTLLVASLLLMLLYLGAANAGLLLPQQQRVIENRPQRRANGVKPNNAHGGCRHCRNRPLSGKEESGDDAMDRNNNDGDKDYNNNSNSVYKIDRANYDIDGNLLPPQVNLRKESLLFGENSATHRRNNARRAWDFSKRRLPFLLTGARSPTTADDDPMAGLHNMAFVRLPTVLAGFLYCKSYLLEGRPFVVDAGDGPFEVNPIAVLTILYFVLR